MANTTIHHNRAQGQPSKSSQVRKLLGTGLSVAEIAKKVGCTANLVYVIKAGVKARKAKRGRPAKATAGAGLDGLAGILDAVKGNARERAQLRGALERIQAVIADALA